MRESMREFLNDLRGQSHDKTAMIIDGMAKVAETAPKEKSYEQFEMERKAKEAQEKARLDRLRRGIRTPDEERALNEGLKSMLGPMREEMEKRRKAEEAKIAVLADRIQNAAQNPERLKSIEDLLEAETDKSKTLEAKIEEAKTEEDFAAVAKYQAEKKEADKNIEVFRSKYNEYSKDTKIEEYETVETIPKNVPPALTMGYKNPPPLEIPNAHNPNSENKPLLQS